MTDRTCRFRHRVFPCVLTFMPEIPASLPIGGRDDFSQPSSACRLVFTFRICTVNDCPMKTVSECLALLRVYMQENARKYGISRMGIFGSVARQEQRQDSDLDIYVEGDLHGFFALSGIKCELEELLGCRVDVVRLREKMDDFLREKIRKEGISV